MIESESLAPLTTIFLVFASRFSQYTSTTESLEEASIANIYRCRWLLSGTYRYHEMFISLTIRFNDNFNSFVVYKPWTANSKEEILRNFYRDCSTFS